MKFADVFGHEQTIARLRRAVAEGRMTGTYLFVGPDGVGKRTLADALTARLLCVLPSTDDACGTCEQCSRVVSGVHPDVRIVTRDAERRDIRIEQTRELCRWLALRPLIGARKVAVIDGADHLNEAGQNSLLKTLEEPPGGTVLLLLAASLTPLLPTVSPEPEAAARPTGSSARRSSSTSACAPASWPSPPTRRSATVSSDRRSRWTPCAHR